jgi:hypothetical protein
MEDACDGVHATDMIFCINHYSFGVSANIGQPDGFSLLGLIV